jgi:hypothetical protein
MNLKDYIITINDLKYCKDIIRNRVLRVEKVEHFDGLPSNGQDFTLYILKNGTVFHYGNFVFSQVELEKQVKEVDKQIKEVKKSKKNTIDVK